MSVNAILQGQSYTRAEVDATPTAGHANPVSSGGVAAALEGVMTKGVDYVTAGELDSDLTADRATSEGYNTIAAGENSHAEGINSFAAGDNSHAEGGAGGFYPVTISTTQGTYLAYVHNYEILSELPEDLTSFYFLYYEYINNSDETNYFLSRITSINTENMMIEFSDANPATTSEIQAFIVSQGALQMYSHAEGWNGVAFGPYSHAEGYFTLARGSASHAEGVGGVALGAQAHVENSNNFAIGSYSHAEGTWRIATGDRSHAEGAGRVAGGSISKSEGQESTVYNITTTASLAVGLYIAYNKELHEITAVDTVNNTVTLDAPFSFPIGTTPVSVQILKKGASGEASHVEGYLTTATATAAHAEGNSTQANGVGSHAEGSTTQANGVGSHAEGSTTQADGAYSHAEGYHTQALNDYNHVFGKWNDGTGDYAEIVGGGSSNTARKNIRTLNWDGKETLAQSLFIDEPDTGKTYARLEIITYGTTSTAGVGRLVLGNATNSGTAGNAAGQILMYRETGSNYMHLLPDSLTTKADVFSFIGTTNSTAGETGTSALMIGNNQKKSAAQPSSTGAIYLCSDESRYHEIKGVSTDTVVHHVLPGNTSSTYWLACGGNGSSAGTGSASEPIYLGADGILRQMSSPLPASLGGTGRNNVYINGVLVGNTTPDTSGGTVTTGGYQSVRSYSGAFYSLGTDQTPRFGILPIAQGGTGVAAPTSAPFQIVPGENYIPDDDWDFSYNHLTFSTSTTTGWKINSSAATMTWMSSSYYRFQNSSTTSAATLQHILTLTFDQLKTRTITYSYKNNSSAVWQSTFTLSADAADGELDRITIDSGRLIRLLKSGQDVIFQFRIEKNTEDYFNIGAVKVELGNYSTISDRFGTIIDRNSSPYFTPKALSASTVTINNLNSIKSGRFVLGRSGWNSVVSAGSWTGLPSGSGGYVFIDSIIYPGGLSGVQIAYYSVAGVYYRRYQSGAWETAWKTIHSGS